MMTGRDDPEDDDCSSLSTLLCPFAAEAVGAGIMTHSATTSPQTAFRPSDPINPPVVRSGTKQRQIRRAGDATLQIAENKRLNWLLACNLVTVSCECLVLGQETAWRVGPSSTWQAT
jgi:hypothetical protein